MATCLFRFVSLCKQAAFAQKAQLEHQVQRAFGCWGGQMLVASCRRWYFQWWMICRSYGTCLRPPTKKNSLFYVSFGFPTSLNSTLVPWVGAGPKLNLLGFERNTTHWMLQVIQVIRCCCLPAVLWRFQISWGFP